MVGRLGPVDEEVDRQSGWDGHFGIAGEMMIMLMDEQVGRWCFLNYQIFT